MWILPGNFPLFLALRDRPFYHILYLGGFYADAVRRFASPSGAFVNNVCSVFISFNYDNLY